MHTDNHYVLIKLDKLVQDKPVLDKLAQDKQEEVIKVVHQTQVVSLIIIYFDSNLYYLLYLKVHSLWTQT